MAADRAKKKDAASSRRVWRPNPGPQERFLECGAFEAMYGGAAGGGKSEALLAGALRHVGNPNYRALLLRRTYPELKRSLIERSQELYRSVGGVYTRQHWRFPSGAVIELGSLKHASDVHNYQSAEYQLIGFDELTTFEESQYVYLISRLRSSHGIPLRLRSATNPGGPGHEWVLKRFGPWLYPPGEPSYKGDTFARPEERLWYRRDYKTNLDVWCPRDWHDPACAVCRPSVPCAEHRPKSRVFFPALVADNPFLHGTEYESNLDLLDPVTREQLKHGNWMIRPAAGAYFKRHWFKSMPMVPRAVTTRVRYWDRAATEGDGDWTVGLRLARLGDGTFVIEDIVRGQWSPGQVEVEMRRAADNDPPGTRLVLEQDPGQAGKMEAAYYLRQFAGFDVRCVPPQGDKVTRSGPVSAQAQAGNIFLVNGPWNELFLREAEQFPEGSNDDQIDALSGAFRQALQAATTTATVTGQREMAGAGGGTKRTAW